MKSNLTDDRLVFLPIEACPQCAAQYPNNKHCWFHRDSEDQTRFYCNYHQHEWFDANQVYSPDMVLINGVLSVPE